MKALLAALVLMFLLVSPGYAFGREMKGSARRELLKKEKRLEDVRKKIREEKKNIEGMAEKETGILGELENINKNLSVKRAEMKKAGSDLLKAHSKVDEASNNLKRLVSERDSLRERLKLRLRAMYKMRSGEAVNALFFSGFYEGQGRRQKYLTVMMDYDRGLIERSGKNLESLSSERRRLEGLYGEMKSAREAASLRKAEAEALHRERVRMLSSIKNEKERSLKTVRELEQAAGTLTELLKKLKAAEASEGGGRGFASMKGSLEMPAAGPVVSSYGKVTHPKFKTVTFNNGIVIEAPAGSLVKSVYGGKVAYAGWLKGYGQLLIIDHGGGFFTLFARLQKILKDKG
ncbi:MAG: peptidoglycan DD-metalloendopeptidase family protein, partial [Deltaproteobacteria bacterium]|nr:peptidoglycan DD-metalloendopeptidase family protein [Deltaproteobacteria bacterium]